MTIIHEAQTIDTTIEKRFSWFMRRFGITKILKHIRADKEKGVSSGKLFAFLLGLVLTHKNLYATVTSMREGLSFGKDTVYRFLNRSSVRWEELVPSLASQVVPEVAKLTSDDRRSALIIDDCPYYRDRSKKVELLSRCKDHSKNRYYKGFTLLNMGWSDGVTFLPVDFRLVASGKDSNLLEGSHIAEDNRTVATRRRKNARTEKPELVLQMLKRVKGTPAETRHVLFDSWFCSPKAILDITGLGYDVVARLKDHENFRYLYDGKILSARQIFRSNKKRRGRAKYLLSVDVQVRHKDYDRTVPAKIVYVRDRGNSKKWIGIISTDTALTEEEIITLYAKRWDIEPFHKIIKSNLRLCKEFQLRSFDGITAHTALVLARYIFFSLESRENADYRSIGELFLVMCEELADISFAHAFDIIIQLLKQCLADLANWTDGYIQAIIDSFFARLPGFIFRKLHHVVCES
jgi:hypothetical protein